METIDLKGIPCPRNTAKALMALELLDDGDRALVIIDDGEPIINFLKSLELEMIYKIEKKEQVEKYWNVYILKCEE